MTTTMHKHGVMAVAVLVLALMLCACNGSQTICDSQCQRGLTYDLYVGFHHGVSPARGVQVLKACRHEPGVLRVGWDRAEGYGVVYTSFFGLKSPSLWAPLRSCLRRSRLVTTQSWPQRFA